MHELVRLAPSPRELLILQMAMAGMADKEIAKRLRITAATVRKHFQRLAEKLGASNRCQIASVAIVEGFVEPVEEGPIAD
jgi:DNA-binding NarL/FixJ family response regulator